MLHLGAVVPNLSFAADAHYHHLVDDIIEGGKLQYEDGAIRVPDAPRPGRPPRPRQAGQVRGALQRARATTRTIRIRPGPAGRRSCQTIAGPTPTTRASRSSQADNATCYVPRARLAVQCPALDPGPGGWHPFIAAASRRRVHDRPRRSPSAPTAAHLKARARRRTGASRRRALRDSSSRRPGSGYPQAAAHPVPRRRPAPAASEAPAPSCTRPARRHLEEGFLHRRS